MVVAYNMTVTRFKSNLTRWRTKQMTNKGFAKLLLGSLLTVSMAAGLSADAVSLKDLIKREPELYMPSQLLPAQTASFTVKAKAGQHLRLMISTQSEGYALENGIPLRIGEPNVTEETIVPENGIAVVNISLPEEIGDVGMQRYVEVVTWSAPDMSDAQIAKIIDPKIGLSQENAIAVGAPVNDDNLGFLPGDAQMGQVLRSISAMSSAGNDKRKKALFDDGEIDRTREIDRNLPLAPKIGTPQY